MSDHVADFSEVLMNYGQMMRYLMRYLMSNDEIDLIAGKVLMK